MNDSPPAVVIGAGVIGLAAARALTLRGVEVLVLERHRRIGEETSSRNSGVIHSGIYYPHGSLKARLCLTGRQMLYAYCEARGVAHSRCGKLIVAQESQLGALEKLRLRGLANGVDDLERLSAAEARTLEPQVRCAGALLSPSTGIVDVHELMTALQGDLEARGGTVVLDTEVLAATSMGDGFVLRVRSGEEVVEMPASQLVNCAGLSAVALLSRIEGYPPQRLTPAYFAKGNYFSCSGKPFKRLVYPMPNEAGLGVHATLDLNGATRFGPDVEWTQALDYHVDPARGESFYAAIREYWPGLPDGALQPGYAGIRPKRVGPGSTAGDFEIEGPEAHGLRGLVNLLGIESPGLTASLAIAREVADLLCGPQRATAGE